MKIYSILDNDLGTFNVPFYQKTDVEAVRNVRMSMKDSMLTEFPNAFALYSLATFDNKTGKFENKTEPEMVVKISDVLEQIKTSEGLRNAIEKN